MAVVAVLVVDVLVVLVLVGVVLPYDDGLVLEATLPERTADQLPARAVRTMPRASVVGAAVGAIDGAEAKVATWAMGAMASPPAVKPAVRIKRGIMVFSYKVVVEVVSVATVVTGTVVVGGFTLMVVVVVGATVVAGIVDEVVVVAFGSGRLNEGSDSFFVYCSGCLPSSAQT